MLKLLENICPDDREVVGTKAYNCSLLLGYGVCAKNGFVVYGDFKEQDKEKIERYAKEDILYAVRSSMGDEDQNKTSNAGKYGTILSVKKTDLADYIQEIWNEAKAERKAVLVQEMVRSEAAGVVFTQNPVNGSNSMIVNVCFGIGENVVSGLMSPDEYIIDKDNINKKIEGKSLVYSEGFDCVPGQHYIFNGCDVRAVISNEYRTLHSIYFGDRMRAVLEDAQIWEVYNMALDLKNRMGTDLDIEFAYENNVLYVLQMRPITRVCNYKERNKEIEQKENTQIIEGQIVSTGIYDGEVLCADIDTINTKSREQMMGKVLVVYELLPDLIYSIDNVGAIITAKGGVLSHGAIVAKEKGIPCITNMGEDICRFKDGMKVTVNADEGRVTIYG